MIQLKVKGKNRRKLFFLLLFGAFICPMQGQSDVKPESSNRSKSMLMNDSTVTDIDGNIYHTVTIGDQTWMVENLKTSHYRNGEAIPNLKVDSIWVSASVGAWCNYNNDSLNDSKYGKLYNYFAIEDTRNLAPVGWHLPTCFEWAILEDYLKIIGFKLNNKSDIKDSEINIANLLAAPTDWAKCSEPGSVGNEQTQKNQTGFYGLPCGYRSQNGPFKSISKSGHWWCVNISNNMLVLSHNLSYDTNALESSLGFKWRGLSVRCVKD
jgi:uncharacterized protein (TIGR02145 family)